MREKYSFFISRFKSRLGIRVNPRIKLILNLLSVIITVILSSCIGISADIVLQKDGSGRITLEYRYSRTIENIGLLDGNEKWNIIPTGKADIERTINRIDGLKLVSFKSVEQLSQTGKDIVNKVVIEFKNTGALLKFLDSNGKHSFLKKDESKNQFYINLHEGFVDKEEQINIDLMDLMSKMSDGYNFNLSFQTDKKSSVVFTDKNGIKIPTPQKAKISSGKKTSIFIPTSDLLEYKNGLGIILEW